MFDNSLSKEIRSDIQSGVWFKQLHDMASSVLVLTAGVKNSLGLTL